MQFTVKAKEFISEKEIAEEEKQQSNLNRQEPRSTHSSGQDSKSLKEILDENREREEEKWNEEHKFQPPKALDEEEYQFLNRKEDEYRLKKLEEQIEEQRELEIFDKTIRSRLIQFQQEPRREGGSPLSSFPSSVVNKNTISPTSLLISQSTNIPMKKEPLVRIIPRKKRKSDESIDGTTTKKIDKNSESETSDQNAIKNQSTNTKRNNNNNIENSKFSSSSSTDANNNALLGLMDAYSDLSESI